MLTYFDPDKWTMSAGNKVRAILLMANVLCFYWLFTSFSWLGLTIGIIGHILLAKVGGDIGVHRYFCHRSFKAKPWAEWLFLILSILVVIFIRFPVILSILKNDIIF